MSILALNKVNYSYKNGKSPITKNEPKLERFIIAKEGLLLYVVF